MVRDLVLQICDLSRHLSVMYRPPRVGQNRKTVARVETLGLHVTEFKFKLQISRDMLIFHFTIQQPAFPVL